MEHRNPFPRACSPRQLINIKSSFKKWRKWNASYSSSFQPPYQFPWRVILPKNGSHAVETHVCDDARKFMRKNQAIFHPDEENPEPQWRFVSLNPLYGVQQTLEWYFLNFILRPSKINYFEERLTNAQRRWYNEVEKFPFQKPPSKRKNDWSFNPKIKFLS